jgi:N-acetylglutamate synthase
VIDAIRAMTKEDLPFVLHLWRTTDGLTLSEDVDSPEALNEFVSRNQAHCFVIEHGKRIIGAIIGGTDGRRGYLYHLAVAQDQRKKGYGRALAESCAKSFEQIGILKCHAMVRSDNPEGRGFWEHLGWQRREDVEILSFISPRLRDC